MAKRNVEAAIEAVSALRNVSPDRAEAGVRAALKDRVNLVAAKAAKVAADLQMRELIPDLLATYDRMFANPTERDPQCGAKTAIAQSLTDLDVRDHAPYLTGARHQQWEATWNGRVDTAQKLRGICLLALVACNDLPRSEISRILVDALIDHAHSVRVEAIRAITEMEGEEAALLVRLKARAGDKETAVTGQAFDSLLRLEPARGLEFVKEYLRSDPEELREEAALALGASRRADAADALLEAWPDATGIMFRKTLLRALGASRQDKALEFLHEIVEAGGMHAPAAKDALQLSPRASS